VFREQVEINARLVIESLRGSSGDQLDEIVIALEIFTKQNEVVAAARTRFHFTAIAVGHRRGFFAAVVAAAFGDVDFATDDGLDVALLASLKKLAAAKDCRGRDGHGGHLLAGGFVEEFARFARAVKKTEVRMNVR